MITLIIGTNNSGKSELAEKLEKAFSPLRRNAGSEKCFPP